MLIGMWALGLSHHSPSFVDFSVCDPCVSSAPETGHSQYLEMRDAIHGELNWVNPNVFMFIKWLARNLNCRIYEGKKKKLFWKSVLNVFRLVSKQWTLPLIQIKNLRNTVYGEIKSKLQTGVGGGFVSKWPQARLPPSYTTCMCVWVSVCVCVNASKSHVEVTENTSPHPCTGVRLVGTGEAPCAGISPLGKLEELFRLCVISQFHSPLKGKKKEWKMKQMHSCTHTFIKSSLESKTAGWEPSK